MLQASKKACQVILEIRSLDLQSDRKQNPWAPKSYKSPVIFDNLYADDLPKNPII